MVVINAPLARHLWPQDDALGRCLWLDEASPCARVVGVMGGSWKFNAAERDTMALDLPMAQVDNAVPNTHLVRTRGEASRSVSAVRAVVQATDTRLPAVRVAILQDVVDRQFATWRMAGTMMPRFAALGLLIVTIGVYGVAVVGVTERTREIAVRMALGARPVQIMSTLVAEVGIAVAVGCALAVGLVAVARPWLVTLLFETSAADPCVIAWYLAAMAIAAACAACVPAIRALRHVSPSDVLRCQ